MRLWVGHAWIGSSAVRRMHPAAANPCLFQPSPLMLESICSPTAQYPGDSGFVQWDKARHEREQREAITMSRLGSAPVEATIK